MNNDLKIHRFLPISYANGPGRRATIWLQGCSLNCPGCYNPDTHNPEGGFIISTSELYDKIVSLKNSIKGITISGGEPLEQAESLAELVQKIRETTNYTIILFTGYEWDELENILNFSEEKTNPKPMLNPNAVKKIINSIDILIAGRFDFKQKTPRHLIGSANKTIRFFTKHYNIKDLEKVPESEIVITSGGNVLISGINPPHLKF